MNLDQIPKVIKDKDYYAKFIQEKWKIYKENKLEKEIKSSKNLTLISSITKESKKGRRKR